MSWSDPCSKCGEHRADCECSRIPQKEKTLDNIIAEKMLEKADITVTLHKGTALTIEEVMKGRSSTYEFINFEEALSEFIKPIKYPTLLECGEFGVKWAQERSYSEEEVKELLKTYRNSIVEVNPIDIMYLDKWFEQFKKK